MADKKIISMEDAMKLAEDKAADLSKTLSVKVHPVVFYFNAEPVTGFLKEPARLTKYRYLDKAMNGPITSGIELLEACLIKDQSDPRLTSESPEYDGLNLAAITAAISLVKSASGSLKKN